MAKNGQNWTDFAIKMAENGRFGPFLL
jgi:hypothetical protein